MIYTVYKITNQLNGKIYIGYTSGTLLSRFRQHCTPKGSSKSVVKFAIQKYGKENFRIEELKTFDNISSATEYEIELISSLSPPYNLCKGNKEVTSRPITKPFTEVGMAKLKEPKSEAMKDKVRKPITLIKEGIVKHFASTHEASLLIGVSNGMVSTVRTGNRPSANGWTLYNGANT